MSRLFQAGRWPDLYCWMTRDLQVMGPSQWVDSLLIRNDMQCLSGDWGSPFQKSFSLMFYAQNSNCLFMCGIFLLIDLCWRNNRQQSGKLWGVGSQVRQKGKGGHFKKSDVIYFTYYFKTIFGYYCLVFVVVRPFPGILQADKNWVAVGLQNRGTHFYLKLNWSDCMESLLTFGSF